MNFVQRGLQKIVILEMAHPLLILLIALTLAALSIFYTVTNLGFQTSQRQLISPDHRLVRLSEQADQFDDLDTFVVAIENEEPSRSLGFLRALVPLLEADRENYAQVFSRVDPKPFKPWALLYLEKKDLLTLKDNLKERHGFIKNLSRSPGLTSFFKQINDEMASKMVAELFTGFLDDKSQGDQEPMDLDFLIRTLDEMKEWLGGKTLYTSPWASFLTKESWSDDSEGYFWTEKKRHLLIFVTPSDRGNGFTSGSHSLGALRKAIAQVRTHFPGVKAGVTGSAALDEDEMVVAFHDMSLATLFSLAGLAALLLIFWRGWRRPLAEILSLLVALSLTFGLTTLSVGHLNILSVSFAPMLLGLGIDYGVHWISRYKEEVEARGASKNEALKATMIKLGPGILLAGLSAALSFFPLVLTGFKGLAELGIICSIGLIMSTVTTLCLLPSLILIFDPAGRRRESAPPSGEVKTLIGFTPRRALLFLVLSFLGLGFSLWGTGRVRFDLNMLHLQSRRAESVIWEKKLVGESKRPSMHGMILARSLEEVQKKTAVLEALPTVSEVQSIRSLLPSDQKEKIDVLKQMKPFLEGVGSLQLAGAPVNLSELDEILGRIRFKMLDSNLSEWGASKPLEAQMKQVRDLIDQLRKGLHSAGRPQLLALAAFENAFMGDLRDKLDLLRANVTTRPMKLEDLPGSLLKRFIGEDHLYLIRVFPSQDIWEPELLGKFTHDLQAVDPDAIGDPITLYIFTQAFRDACIKAAIYAAVFIFILLMVTFRNLISALTAMTPLIVGTVWTLGLMNGLGVDLNLANSIFLPLVVGAGVEYGIIIVQRWRQRTEEEKDTVLPFSTGVGVILAGLTTTVGFGSLALSDHQGLYSLGILTTIGSLAILAAAVLFLPALLTLLAKFRPGIAKQENPGPG